MVVPRLANYIKTQLNSGYDINTIRNYLIKYGYNRNEVEQAITYIYGKKEKKIPTWAIISLAVIGILFLIILMVVIFSGDEQPAEIIFEQPEVFFPEEEIIEEEIIQEIEQPIIEEQDQILDLDFQEQDLAQCPSNCEDFDECTRDYCGIETAYQCVNENIIPCCGNNFCDVGEDSTTCSQDCKEIVTIPSGEETITDVVNKAEELAESSPSKAANYCDDQDEQNFKDSCYSIVSEVVQDSSYCTPISSDIKRDSCYTTAVLNNDFTVCEKMTNEYLKSSCENLALAST